ncbi:MAG: isoprenyl transferase [Cellulosilyticaceae bacterium]
MVNNKLPEHVAIIMDGNGRWAKMKGLSRNEGHKKGADVLKKISEHANEIGIKYMTVYAFSTENWKRPKEEVDGLMNLLRRHLDRHLKDAKKNNIRFRVLGDKQGLPEDLQDKMRKLENITAEKTGMTVNLAINYGGRDELVRAFKRLAAEKGSEPAFLESITEELVAEYLDTSGMPDPDLMIRTSGEERTSNFLPWQLAYSEFYFTPCLWPEFTKEHFNEALEVYAQRKRRFGKSE